LLYRALLTTITKEKLEELYINKQMSAIDIQKYFNLGSFTQIYKKLKEFNIPISCSESYKKSKKKRDTTHIKMYGCKHNFCKDSPSRKDWEKRLLDEEGITNVFQRKEVIEQIGKTMVEKYKHESPQRVHTCRGKNMYSSIHKQVVGILNENNIDCKIEYKISKKKSGYYSYDIIVGSDKLIEVYGDYWHGNPKLYTEDNIILKGSSREMTVKEKRKFDSKKTRFAKSNGFKIMIVWENDIKNNYEKTVKKILSYCSSKN